jgi:hypothetical protein
LRDSGDEYDTTVQHPPGKGHTTPLGFTILGAVSNCGNSSGEESDGKGAEEQAKYHRGMIPHGVSDEEVADEQAKYHRQLSRQGASDDAECHRRQTFRVSGLDPQEERERHRLFDKEESEINQLPRDEHGNEICTEDEADGYGMQKAMVFRGQRPSKGAAEVSESAHHFMMVESDSKRSATTRNDKVDQLMMVESDSKRSATTRNDKVDQLTKLWKAYAVGLGSEREENFSRPNGPCIELNEDSDSTHPPNNKAPKQQGTVFSPISVGDLQDLGTVLKLRDLSGCLSATYAFFRCQDGHSVGKLRWTGGNRSRKGMIQQNTLLGTMEAVHVHVEDVEVFIGRGHPEYGRWLTDTTMALLGEAVARSSLVPGKKKVRSVWMETFVYDKLLGKSCRQMNQKGGGNAVWAELLKRFKGDKKGIGTCGMIFFAINRTNHWTLLAGNTVTRAWTWFDGYEPAPNATRSRCHPNPNNWRKSGREAGQLIKNFAHQLSYVMNRAAIEYPDIKGYQKFRGDWTLDTVHADKIPVQTDSWSCGQRVLLLADMLASGYNVRDMLDMYSDDDMPAIHQEMGHYALGLMQDATPMTKVGAQWVTSSWC